MVYVKLGVPALATCGGHRGHVEEGGNWGWVSTPALVTCGGVVCLVVD